MNRSIRRTVGIALLLTEITLQEARSQPVPPEPACVSIAAVGEAAERAGAVVVHDFRGADAADWLTAYNAIPPVTAIAGDQVVLLEREGAASMLVVVLTQGCVTAAWQEGRRLVGRVADSVLPGI